MSEPPARRAVQPTRHRRWQRESERPRTALRGALLEPAARRNRNRTQPSRAARPPRQPREPVSTTPASFVALATDERSRGLRKTTSEANTFVREPGRFDELFAVGLFQRASAVANPTEIGLGDGWAPTRSREKKRKNSPTRSVTPAATSAHVPPPARRDHDQDERGAVRFLQVDAGAGDRAPASRQARDRGDHDRGSV